MWTLATLIYPHQLCLFLLMVTELMFVSKQQLWKNLVPGFGQSLFRHWAVSVAVVVCFILHFSKTHVCLHCRAQLEKFGMQGLSCKKNQGRYFRHAAVNHVAKRSLGTN